MDKVLLEMGGEETRRDDPVPEPETNEVPQAPETLKTWLLYKKVLTGGVRTGDYEMVYDGKKRLAVSSTGLGYASDTERLGELS